VSDHYASASLEKLRDFIEQIDVIEEDNGISCNILNAVSYEQQEG